MQKTLKASGMASMGRNYSGPSLDPTEKITVLMNNDSQANLEKTRYIRVRLFVWCNVYMCSFPYALFFYDVILRQNRSIEAPVAVGRSGARPEKGTSTSGLLGERLNMNPEPRINSLVQRSWMYTSDPALDYKINGVPRARMPNDVSLAIGYDPNVEVMDNRSNETIKDAWSWSHQRKSTITAEPTSRAIGDGVHVFMDDQFAPGFTQME